jgi:hypothetical protein
MISDPTGSGYTTPHRPDLNWYHLALHSFEMFVRYYGIEAAYRTIVREVKNVFAVYGIDVDYRHLRYPHDKFVIVQEVAQVHSSRLSTFFRSTYNTPLQYFCIFL